MTGEVVYAFVVQMLFDLQKLLLCISTFFKHPKFI
jgi:hypothetical protein